VALLLDISSLISGNVYRQALAVIARQEAISLFMLSSLGGTKQSAVSVLSKIPRKPRDDEEINNYLRFLPKIKSDASLQ